MKMIRQHLWCFYGICFSIFSVVEHLFYYIMLSTLTNWFFQSGKFFFKVTIITFLVFLSSSQFPKNYPSSLNFLLLLFHKICILSCSLNNIGYYSLTRQVLLGRWKEKTVWFTRSSYKCILLSLPKRHWGENWRIKSKPFSMLWTRHEFSLLTSQLRDLKNQGGACIQKQVRKYSLLVKKGEKGLACL